ncbi:MAG TPA: lipase family protein [Solirubrobacteraceae bacterium]|nr:lipase family protein [Solirubrobacteraceae bacterium]
MPKREIGAAVLASIVATLALWLAPGLATASVPATSTAAGGSFYEAPARLPRRPGTLLRYESFVAGVPPGGLAWRILYTTTRADGSETVASAVVLAPAAAGSGTPLPLIAWAHGTTGVAGACAPSLLGGNSPFYAGIPSVEAVLHEGWALVATDYPGLGTAGPTPYLQGSGEARSVLDSIRAAHDLPTVRLSKRTVLWGHSQGGQAVLWSGIVGPDYAPDVRIAGIAAIAPVSGLGMLTGALGDSPTGQVLRAYMLSSYASAYPDLSLEAQTAPGGAVLVRALAERCLEGPQPAVPYLEALPAPGPPLFPPGPITGAWADRLRQNVPSRLIAAPLLIAQGLEDGLAGEQQRYVEQRCAAGQRLEYRTYAGLGHTSIDEDGSPLIGDLLTWTGRRFGGSRRPSGCSTVAR